MIVTPLAEIILNAGLQTGFEEILFLNIMKRQFIRFLFNFFLSFFLFILSFLSFSKKYIVGSMIINRVVLLSFSFFFYR